MLLAFACLRRRVMCMHSVDMPRKWIQMLVLKAISFDAVGYAPHGIFICDPMLLLIFVLLVLLGMSGKETKQQDPKQWKM